MPTKEKIQRKRGGILDAVYETSKDLRSAGVITKRRMDEYEALCLPEIPAYSTEDIRRLRGNLSQTVFAAILNTSPSTVRKWEVGDKHPSGPSLKLLYLVDTKGIEALL